MIRLGEHFSLEEMCKTSREWDNVPQNIHIVELTRLVSLTLDPLREDVGLLHTNSGFRCDVVNKEVGGSLLSFHLRGCAWDGRSDKHTPRELMAIVHALKLPYDKMIAEDNGKSKWLHIQLQPAGAVNRFEKYKSHIEDGKMVYTKL